MPPPPAMIPRNILVIAEGQLGDLLILTPALRALKESFPEAALTVLVLERRRPASGAGDGGVLAGPLSRDANNVLATNPHVDSLFILNRDLLRSMHGARRVREEIGIVRYLRTKSYDTVISTFPQDRFALWALATKASVRVGQRHQGLSWLLTHTPEVRKEEGGVLEYYCRLAEAAGARVRVRSTEYHIPPASQQWADEFLRENAFDAGMPFVAVHPGATGDYKIWPPERYAALMESVLKEGGVKVLLCSGRLDREVVGAIKMCLRTQVVEVHTGDNAGRLAALLKRASLCISNDSGPRHLAVAVGTRSLAFFRQCHDREWKIYADSERCMTLQGSAPCPVCPPGVCRDLIPPGEHFGSHCLRTIAVDRARASVAGLLRSPVP